MIPILYAAAETAFATNGLGTLADTIGASVTQEINGRMEVKLTYPVGGLHYEQIRTGCILVMEPDQVTGPQPYRIYQIRNGTAATIEIHARHLAYDLMGMPVAPYTAQTPAEAVAGIKTNSVVDCPFNFSTDVESVLGFASTKPEPAWSLMGRDGLLKLYGGEYLFDGYDVRLQTQIGQDRGVELRYGKNIVDLQQDENIAEVYTGVYPYWTDGTTMVELPDRVVPAPGTHDHIRILTLDLSDRWEAAPTAEDLQAAADQYIIDNHVGVPEIAWTIEWEQLEGQTVGLGDLVTVYFTELGVSGQARVVRTEYDPLLERYTRIHVGRVVPTIATTILKQQHAAEEIAKKSAEKLDRSLTQEELMDRLTNGGQDQGIYLLDGKIYVNAEYLRTGILDAQWIKLRDKFAVYKPGTEGEEPVLGGYLGFIEGEDASGPTEGIGLMSPDGTNYIVATTAGALMRTRQAMAYLVPGDGTLGKFVIDAADLYVSGQIHQNYNTAAVRLPEEKELM